MYATEFFASMSPDQPRIGRLGERAWGIFRIGTGLWLMYLTFAARLTSSSTTTCRCSEEHMGVRTFIDEYLAAETLPTGFWSYTRQYLASLPKAWWGDATTADKDSCYDTCRG
jgi:hypothetical protein